MNFADLIKRAEESGLLDEEMLIAVEAQKFFDSIRHFNNGQVANLITTIVVNWIIQIPAEIQLQTLIDFNTALKEALTRGAC